MNNKINKIFSGYIEGYYGNLLSWKNRLKIIHRLKKNLMNFYFYAPKEDKEHRFNWKEPYKKNWLKSFNKFSSEANLKGISIIAGIAPGLDYDFNYRNNNKDFDLLKKKSQQLIDNGANFVSLMFDDIPNNFEDVYGQRLIEGKTHANLANALANELNCKIFVVPRIYAKELTMESPEYIYEFGKYLQKDIGVFHCGNKIVSKSINQSNINNLRSDINNELIFWDNLYANDYCPRRLFVSPWYNRSLENIMINPTGMIQTDLLILDIIGESRNNLDIRKSFLNTLSNYKIPKEFSKLLHYFKNPVLSNINETQKSTWREEIQIIDTLLWEWKSKLSLEWYPYLMGLKQDILIKSNKLKNNRIMKTQTKPLSIRLLKF